MTTRARIDAAEDVGMQDRLRTLAWVAAQLGFNGKNPAESARQWCARNGITVKTSRVKERHFLDVWESPTHRPTPKQLARRALQ